MNDRAFLRIGAAAAVVGAIIAVAGNLLHPRQATARFARVAVAVGAAIALAQLAVETFAFKQAARAFVAAEQVDQVGAFWAANAIDKINTGLFATWTVVYLGIAPLLLGVATLRNRVYPTVLA